MDRKKPPSRSRPASRGRRGLRIGSAVVIAVLLAYPAVGNLLLHTESGRQFIMPRSERVTLDWSRAWTVLPGLVHASDLRIDVDNPHLAWGLRAEKSHVWINLLALPSRHFSVISAHAEGFSCRFDRPKTERARPPKQRKHPWRISLSDVRLDGLRGCTSGDYRLVPVEGRDSTRLSGSLDLRLRGPVELREIALDLANVELREEEQSIARFSKIEGQIDSRPFEIRLVKGRRLLRSFSGEIGVSGETRSLGFINEFLAKAPWLDLKSGPGRLDSRLVFDRGLLLPGSRVHFESDDVAIQYLDYVAHGTAELSGTVEGQIPTIIAAFREFSLRQEGVDDAHVLGEELKIRVDAAAADLAETPDVRLQLDIPRSGVPDLTIYNRFMPARAGLEITGGAGTMEAHLVLSTGEVPATRTDDDSTTGEVGERFDPEVLSADGGWIEIASPDLGVRASELDIRGALTVKAEVDNVDTESRSLRVSRARVTMDNATIERSQELIRSDWRAALELDDGEIALSRPMHGRSRLQLSMSDLQPILVFFSERRPRIETVARLLKVENITGDAELELGENLLTIDGLDVQGDRIELEGRLCLGSEVNAGTVHVRAFGVGLASSFDGTGRRWTLLRPRRWYEDKLRSSSCSPVNARHRGAVIEKG